MWFFVNSNELKALYSQWHAVWSRLTPYYRDLTYFNLFHSKSPISFIPNGYFPLQVLIRQRLLSVVINVLSSCCPLILSRFTSLTENSFIILPLVLQYIQEVLQLCWCMMLLHERGRQRHVHALQCVYMSDECDPTHSRWFRMVWFEFDHYTGHIDVMSHSVLWCRNSVQNWPNKTRFDIIISLLVHSASTLTDYHQTTTDCVLSPPVS